MHNCMFESVAKKFCTANIGDNVVVPIERPDKNHLSGTEYAGSDHRCIRGVLQCWNQI